MSNRLVITHKHFEKSPFKILHLFQEALDQSALAAMATSDPSSFHAQLQLGMERILSVAAKLADSESTRDYHQHSLISQCNGVKERLQKLLTALKRIGGDGVEGVEGEEDWGRVISECVTDVGEKVVELRKEVCWIISVELFLLSP